MSDYVVIWTEYQIFDEDQIISDVRTWPGMSYEDALDQLELDIAICDNGDNWTTCGVILKSDDLDADGLITQDDVVASWSKGLKNPEIFGK